MVLEEQPGKIAEAFRLFLLGEGYGKCWLYIEDEKYFHSHLFTIKYLFSDLMN